MCCVVNVTMCAVNDDPLVKNVIQSEFASCAGAPVPAGKHPFAVAHLLPYLLVPPFEA